MEADDIHSVLVDKWYAVEPGTWVFTGPRSIEPPLGFQEPVVEFVRGAGPVPHVDQGLRVVVPVSAIRAVQLRKPE
jgi:hypothetical protein